eukprot:403370187
MRHIENEIILDQDVDNDFEKSELLQSDNEAEDEIERLRKEIMKENEKNRKKKIIMRKQTFHKVKEFQKKQQGCLYNLKCKKQPDLDVSTDDSIDSNDCVEESILFRIMNGKQRQEHLQKKWQAAFNKARAGFHVMRLFGDLQKKIILFGISNQLEIYEKESTIEKIVLMPDGRFLSIWNLVIILLLIYTAIAQPFLMAFHQTHSGIQEWLDRIVDIIFTFDILIIFISAYEENDGSLQHRHNYIARKYIKSWFVYDVISIQINYFKQSETYHKIEKKIKMNNAIFRQIISMMAAIIIAHIFACFWYITARINDFGPDTWVFRRRILDNEVYAQYMLAYYWSSQTITTLGYGDIPAVTEFEIALSLIWMGVGVAFYSFVVGNFTSILVGNVEIQATISMKIISLKELARKAQIPFELMVKIKSFIENNYETLHNQEEEANLVKDLPPSLRDEVFSNTYGEIIQTVEYFRNITDSDFLWRILPLLKPVKLEKDDVLYWKGDLSEDIYFILKGTIRLYSGKGYPFVKYEQGSMFGDCDSLLNLPRVGKAIAQTHLNILILKVDKNFEKSFIKQEKNLLQMILNARKKRNYHLQLIDKANKRQKQKKLEEQLKKKAALALNGNFNFGIFRKQNEEENPSLLQKIRKTIQGAFTNTKSEEERKSQSQAARSSDTQSNGRITIKDANVGDLQIDKMSASPASGPRSNYIPVMHNYFQNNIKLDNQTHRKSNAITDSPKLNINKNHVSEMDQFYSVFKQPNNQINLLPPIQDNQRDAKINEKLEQSLKNQIQLLQNSKQNSENINVESFDQEFKTIQIPIPEVNIPQGAHKSNIQNDWQEKLESEISSNINQIIYDSRNKGQESPIKINDKLQILKNGLNKNLIKKQLNVDILHKFDHNLLGIMPGGSANNDMVKLTFQYNNLDAQQYDDVNSLSPYMKNNKQSILGGGKSPKTPAQPTLLEKVMNQTFNKVELEKLQSQFNIIKEINMDEEEHRDMSMKPKYSKQIEKKRAEFKQASKHGNSGQLDISHRSNLSYVISSHQQKSKKKRYFLKRTRRPLSPSSVVQTQKSIRQRSMETGLNHGKTIKGSARLPKLRNQIGSSTLSDSLINSQNSISNSESQSNNNANKKSNDKSLSFNLLNNQTINDGEFKNTDQSVKTLQNVKTDNWRQNYLGNLIQINSTPSKKQVNKKDKRQRNFDVSAMSVDFKKDKKGRQSKRVSKKNMKFLLGDLKHVENIVKSNNCTQNKAEETKTTQNRQQKSLFAFNKKTEIQNKSDNKLVNNLYNNSELEFSSEASGNLIDINLTESKRESAGDKFQSSKTKNDLKEIKNFTDQYFSVIDVDQSKKLDNDKEEQKTEQFLLKEDIQLIDNSSSFFQTQAQSPRKSDNQSRNFQTSMIPPKRATVSPLIKDMNHLEVKSVGGYSQFMLSNPTQLLSKNQQITQHKRVSSFKIYITKPSFHLQIQQNTQSSGISSTSSKITNRYVSPFSLQRLQQKINFIRKTSQLEKVTERSHQDMCSSSEHEQITGQITLQNQNVRSRNQPNERINLYKKATLPPKYNLRSKFYRQNNHGLEEHYSSTISEAVSLAMKNKQQKKIKLEIQKQLKNELEIISPIKIETNVNKFEFPTNHYFTQNTESSQSPLIIGLDSQNQFDFSGVLGLLQGGSRVDSNFILPSDPSLPLYIKQETDNSSYFKPQNMRNVLIEEIYNKFPSEFNNELKDALSEKQTNNKTINSKQKFQIPNEVETKNKQLVSNNKLDHIQIYPNKNELIEEQSNKDLLVQEINEKDQFLEFKGDSDMVGLLQFNTDMSHIAMNIFETFSIFDSIDQRNKLKQIALQEIRQQSQVIEQRQENVDRKLNEIEQQLKKLKQQTHLNLDYSDVSIVFKETSS